MVWIKKCSRFTDTSTNTFFRCIWYFKTIFRFVIILMSSVVFIVRINLRKKRFLLLKIDVNWLIEPIVFSRWEDKVAYMRTWIFASWNYWLCSVSFSWGKKIYFLRMTRICTWKNGIFHEWCHWIWHIPAPSSTFSCWISHLKSSEKWFISPIFLFINPNNDRIETHSMVVRRSMATGERNSRRSTKRSGKYSPFNHFSIPYQIIQHQVLQNQRIQQPIILFNQQLNGPMIMNFFLLMIFTTMQLVFYIVWSQNNYSNIHTRQSTIAGRYFIWIQRKRSDRL